MLAIVSFILRALTNTLAAPGQGAKYFARPHGSYISFLRDVRLQAEDLGGALGENPDPLGAEGERAYNLLKEVARDKAWTEVTDYAKEVGAAFGQCRYFRAPAPEGSFEGVALLSELTDAELASVKVQLSGHGQDRGELVSTVISPRETRQMHLALGAVVGGKPAPFTEPTEETAVVYSWYPGRLTAQVPVQPIPEEAHAHYLRRGEGGFEVRYRVADGTDFLMETLPGHATVKLEG